MNNLLQQKFQFLRFTEDGPNNDIYGNAVWDTDKIFLSLTSRESYCQYLDLGLDANEVIDSFSIETESGQELTLGIHFYYNIRKIDSKYILIFGLKNELKDLGCKTFSAVMTTNKRKIYSNFFNFIYNESELSETTMLTYWHKENYYNANYYESNFMPQQIRVPIAFSHNYSEGEAESYQDSYQVENKYRSGRVKRLFMESWKVLMNDSNYTALCTALDSDFVYFDNIFVSLKPFTPERDKDEKGFSLSSIDGQRNPSNVFDQSIFSQYFNISADDVIYEFDYDHTPENTNNAGQFFLVNRLFTNYKNDFGILLNCDLKIKLTKIPSIGFLANNLTRNIYQLNDIISYCDKDDLVYFPNGFNNNLGSNGDFNEEFKYKIIDHNGNISSVEMTSTLKMNDIYTAAPSTCEIPVINSVQVEPDGKIILDYTVSTINLSTPEYQFATDINFTNIVHYRVGFYYTQLEQIQPLTNVQDGTTLYVRVKKHCSNSNGSSQWSSVVSFNYDFDSNYNFGEGDIYLESSMGNKIQAGSTIIANGGSFIGFFKNYSSTEDVKVIAFPGGGTQGINDASKVENYVSSPSSFQIWTSPQDQEIMTKGNPGSTLPFAFAYSGTAYLKVYLAIFNENDVSSPIIKYWFINLQS